MDIQNLSILDEAQQYRPASPSAILAAQLSLVQEEAVNVAPLPSDHKSFAVSVPYRENYKRCLKLKLRAKKLLQLAKRLEDPEVVGQHEEAFQPAEGILRFAVPTPPSSTSAAQALVSNV